MKRFCIILFSLFCLTLSLSKAENKLNLYHHGNRLTLTLKYRNDNNIKLYVKGVESFNRGKRVYFWLNDGETTKGYVVLVCNKLRDRGREHCFRLSREDYEQIAFNCQSVSIGRCAKIVRHRNIRKVQRYFIEQELEYKNKLWRNSEKRNAQLRLEIAELKYELQKLSTKH